MCWTDQTKKLYRRLYKVHLHSGHDSPAASTLLLIGSHPCSETEQCLDFVCLFHSSVHFLQAKRQLSPWVPAGFNRKKEEWERFYFQQIQSLSNKSFKKKKNSSSKSFMRCWRQHLSSLQRIGANSNEWDFTGTLTFLWSRRDVFFPVVEQILQKPCRGLRACLRCFFQMLKAPAIRGLGVFSSPLLLPRGGGGVGGCAVIQSGGVSNKLISILRTLRRKSDHTSHHTSCDVCYIIPKKEQFWWNHMGNQTGRGVEINAGHEIVQEASWFVLHKELWFAL